MPNEVMGAIPVLDADLIIHPQRSDTHSTAAQIHPFG